MTEKWYAVIGRFPFDDEDTCHVYYTESPEKAAEKFDYNMYAASPDRDREATIREHGSAVFITHVLASSMPIDILRRPA